MSSVTSETQIANMALNRLGVEPISSLNDNTKRAKVLKNLFDITRNNVLEAAPWNFAMQRVILTPLASAPLFDFSNKFSLPSDVLRVWSVTSGGSTSGSSGVKHPYDLYRLDPEIDYRVEGNDLVSDISKAYVIYIKEISDVTLFSPGFVKAFYLTLAAEASYSIIQNTTEKNSLIEEAEFYISRAASVNSQEDELEDFQFDHFITPRFS